MRIAIIEPYASGHRMTLYARNAINGFLGRGWDVVLLTSKGATSHPSFIESAASWREQIQIHTYAAPPDQGTKLKAAALLRWQLAHREAMGEAVKRSAKSSPIDWVYLNTLDYVDKGLSLLGSPFGRLPFSGLLMSVRFRHARLGVSGSTTRSDAIYSLLFKRLLSLPSLKHLGVIDELLLG